MTSQIRGQSTSPSGGSKKPAPQTKNKSIDTTWMLPGALCWIDMDPPMNAPSKTICFEQGTIVVYDDGMVTVKIANAASQYRADMVLERAQPVKTVHFNGFEDMVNMETLNDAELLNNIIVRFSQDYIFTYVGPTLLVVNPFKLIKGMFEQEVREKYIKFILKAKGNPLAYKDLEPHVYAVAAEAYRSLFENDKNQAIVISGESGAGKTENAKFCMNLLTSISGLLTPNPKQGTEEQIPHQQGTIEDKILGCNPILESFGNAKTVRNNNSSRFGKYVRMIVNKTSQKIKGAEIVNYLLEKSRITQQGKNERNFHIFYHFILGSTLEDLTKFKMVKDDQRIPMDQFEYLRTSECFTVQGIDDVQLFQEIQVSIKVLGLHDFYFEIFAIVAAVLIIGNIEFDESTFGNTSPCSVKDQIRFKDLADLVQMDIDVLAQALTMKQITSGKEVIDSPLPAEECKAARDSLAKEMYDRLFNWIVIRLNETIQPVVKETNFVCVGLLDIYGFEVFAQNGFEQLMINYTNEKLHQLYINYVFKEEERVFIKEGLKEFSGQIVFHDNKEVIDLLDGKLGLFNLLDESCQVKSSDKALIQKIRQTNEKNPLMVNPKIPSNPTFIIVHTAKDVEYTITGFREKNKDELSVMTQLCMEKSKNTLIKRLFKVEPAKDPNKKQAKFLASKIKEEMVELMTELNSCDVHFVRCLKPNEEKLFNLISQNMTLKQIRYLGVLDSLKVRKESYPIRRNYQAFYKRYGDMTKNKIYPHLIKENTDFRELTVEMFKQFYPQLSHDKVLFGTSRIFIKQDVMNLIEDTYKKEMVSKNKRAVKLQKSWKVYKIRRGLKKILIITSLLRKLAQRVKARTLQKKRNRACLTQKITTRFKIRVQIRWIYIQKRKKARKYKESSRLFQLFIKRFYNMEKITRKKKSVEKLQRFARQIKTKQNIIRRKLVAQIFDVNNNFYINQRALDDAWFQIQNNAANKIQKVWRGYHFRKTHKKEVRQIKDAFRQKKIEKNIVKLQRAVRLYLRIERQRVIHRAAFYIQGYFRMRWLSELFQQIRQAVPIIQSRIRTYLAKKRAFEEKFQQYIQPWEDEINLQKQQETNSFWNTKNETTNLSPFNIYDNSDMASQGGYSNQGYSSPSKFVITSHQSPQQFQIDESNAHLSTVDQCILKWKPRLPKMILFMFPIDLDLSCDMELSYHPNYSYSKTLLNIMSQQMRKDHPIQTINITEQSTLCVTVGGTSVYEFGENKFIGRSAEETYKEGVEKILLPENIKIKSVASTDQHLLLITTDGTLLQYGDPTQIWPGLEYRPYVHIQQVQACAATSNASFMVTSDSRLFTWPVQSMEQLIRHPVNVRVPQRVKSVQSGNQFAAMLCENGTIYCWGENIEGELGLGDTQIRTEPCLVSTLTNEKFVQLSCGFKHVLAKSSQNKVYSWGWGERGQLGHSDFKNSLIPKLVPIPEKAQILWASCGRTTSFLISENKTIYWCGTNSMIKYQSAMMQFRIETRSSVLNQPHYIPLRVISSYSKTMEVTYITFANVSTCLEDNHNKRNKMINKLIQLWSESPDPFSEQFLVDPPYNQSISHHIYEASMRKPGQQFIRQNINHYFQVQRAQQDQESDFYWQIKKTGMLNIMEQFRYERQIQESTQQQCIDFHYVFQDETVFTEKPELNRDEKLHQIKKRLIQIQNTPQERWNEDDINFVQTIYQQPKISNLLKAVEV